MKRTDANLDYPDCGNPDRETGVNVPYPPYMDAAIKARKEQLARQAASEKPSDNSAS